LSENELYDTSHLGSESQRTALVGLARGADVSRDFFEARDGLVATCRAAMPLMMTTDPAVAKSGCLFYRVRSREALAS
jgi:hypothetical protein